MANFLPTRSLSERHGARGDRVQCWCQSRWRFGRRIACPGGKPVDTAGVNCEDRYIWPNKPECAHDFRGRWIFRTSNQHGRSGILQKQQCRSLSRARSTHDFVAGFSQSFANRFQCGVIIGHADKSASAHHTRLNPKSTNGTRQSWRVYKKLRLESQALQYGKWCSKWGSAILLNVPPGQRMLRPCPDRLAVLACFADVHAYRTP